jgi:catechol 2,3-dioxygenase-like lactoylglutathione lyase family enzyme
MVRYATHMSQNDSAISFRYLVHDVSAAVDFYRLLGCEVRMHPGPGFAQLTFDGVAINLNAVGGDGGASQRVAGDTPVPGGWNRIQLRVEDLESRLASLADSGVEPVDGVVEGRGGRQALVRDPSGNLVELFQPYSA